MAQVTGSALVQIQRFEPDDTVTVAGSWGAAPHPFQPGTNWSLEGSQIAAPIRRTGRPVRVDDFGVGSGPIRDGVRTTGIRGGAGAPIVVDGELWGAMAAGPAKGEPVPARLEHAARRVHRARRGGDLERPEPRGVGAARRGAVGAAARGDARREGAPPAELFAAVAREAGLLIGADAMHMGRYDAGTAVSVAGWSRDGRSPADREARRARRHQRRIARVPDTPGRRGSTPTEGRQCRPAAPRDRRTAVAVPIVVHGRLWGLMVASARPAATGRHRVRLLGFTELAETAIANSDGARGDRRFARPAAGGDRRGAPARGARSPRRRRAAARRDDRHDRPCGRRARRRRGPRAREFVEQALTHAERTTAELHELAQGILPTVLTSGGLRAAAAALAARMAVPTAVDVSADRQSDAVEATAYFVIAEALTNVAKHAGARHATVGVVDGGALQVQVGDDGRGGARLEGRG